jgi:hypothetical protein
MNPRAEIRVIGELAYLDAQCARVFRRIWWELSGQEDRRTK